MQKDNQTLDPRIAKLFTFDVIWGATLLFFTWVSVLWVTFSVIHTVQNPAIETVIVITAFLVCIFNLACTVAMFNHYRKDKEHVYSMDLMHSDRNRAERDRSLKS